MASPRPRVCGVAVDAVTEAEVLVRVRQAARRRELLRIATVNAEFVVRAVDDPAFARVLETADLATADGAGVVWALRRQGYALPTRVGGSDLIYSMCELAASEHLRVFFLGAAPGVAEETARRLAERYPALRIAGAYAGSPSSDEATSIIDLVRRSAADILFVAYGAPEQEYWLAAHLLHTGATVGIGVGGTFDYVAGVARRAPVWMRDHGLDWLWRLVQQPRRWRRMLALPRFVWMAWRSTLAPMRIERTTD